MSLRSLIPKTHNMTLGIFQDLHANLPALEKAIQLFRFHRCEKIIHVGDLIGIGPFPKECLELSLSIKEMELIMGNHDYLYPHGIPESMNEDEKKHQEWTHSQIGDIYKTNVREWPFIKSMELTNQRDITFQHYGFDNSTNWFKEHIAEPNEDDLDKMFEGTKSDIIFYGHNHQASDIVGKSRYVNLGSAGCHFTPEVRVGILYVSDTKMNLEKYSGPYDDNKFMEAFEIRKVPARDFIKKKFILRK